MDAVTVEVPADLPPHIVSLARAIARDCKQPGHYTVSLDVSPHAGEPLSATITRTERLRVMELKVR